MTQASRAAAYNVRVASMEGPKDTHHENRGSGLVGRDTWGMCRLPAPVAVAPAPVYAAPAPVYYGGYGYWGPAVRFNYYHR